MKHFISVLLTFFSFVSFGQITLLDIQKVYKMDFDQFEAYSISKGYEFINFENDENINGIVYTKGVGKATKYIKIYDKLYSYKKHFSYQTSNTNEVLNLKIQVKKSGFKLHDTYFDDEGTKVEKFRHNLFEFVLWTIPSDDENPWVRYEIGYRKSME